MCICNNISIYVPFKIRIKEKKQKCIGTNKILFIASAYEDSCEFHLFTDFEVWKKILLLINCYKFFHPKFLPSGDSDYVQEALAIKEIHYTRVTFELSSDLINSCILLGFL